MTNDKFIEHCPLCNSKDKEKLYDIKRSNPAFTIYRCKSCSFQFMNPPFSDETIKSFYTEDYYKGRAEYTYIDERETEKFSSYVWDARIRTIRKYVKSGNFLDVGSSFGGFISRAARFFTPYGIEISEYSADFSKKRFGENIHIGTLDNHGFQHDFFSVITMVEVIEHLKDPKKAIDECYRLLKDGGVLLLQTANMDGWQATSEGESYHYYLPGHLSYFTENNLKDALIKAGFKRVIVHIPVDFGLIPKLRKSRGSFKKLSDYRRWIDISIYHFKGKFRKEGRPLTSSMVVYAIK